MKKTKENKNLYKTGNIAIIGKTNAGKSTLINTLVGEKVAIVSPKTQTTRDNILGILTEEFYQLVFIDTPGIHKSLNNLDRKMNKNVRSAISSVDIILYLLDASKKVSQDEIDYITHIKQVPVILALSKADLVNQSKVLELINLFKKAKNIHAIIPISSKEERNLDVLISEILANIEGTEEKVFYFDDDEYTDKSVKFMISEIIREKALLALQEEIPHGIAVNIPVFNEDEKIVNIQADIICEKDSHKNIIIGKGGAKIKEISSRARIEIEEFLGKKVMLQTWVKVVKNWRNRVNLNSILE